MPRLYKDVPVQSTAPTLGTGELPKVYPRGPFTSATCLDIQLGGRKPAYSDYPSSWRVVQLGIGIFAEQSLLR